MSTFYIYPLEGHGQPLSKDLLDTANDAPSLGSTGLSRILEIPLNLMDTTKDQQQMLWISTNTTASTTIAAEIPNTTNDIVTHSFANRKRSIVKRRKSVLSASFTADEAETIRTDRETTLAALERGSHEHDHIQSEEIQEHQESRELDTQEQDELYSQKNQTFTIEDEQGRPGYFSMNHDGALSMERNEEGPQSDQEQLVPQEEDVKGAIAMNPNDSAIDLRTVVSAEQEETKTLDCSVTTMSSVAKLSESLPSSPSVTPMTKKKVSSWSPRRIFSSSSNSSNSSSNNDTANTKKISKKSSSASLNSDGSSSKPEKFHLSSLFSRKNDKKKKKAPDHSLDPNSPYLSSTETLFETPKRVNQFNYTRLPIHTERAIYRLSHMKLTNPRRPLHDQVTISNLMFWYLSVVSQTTTANSQSEPKPAINIKSCRMQIKHQQKNHKNKRRMHPTNQVRPDSSNAMDMFHKQQKNSQQQMYRQKKNVSAPTLGARPRYQRTHLRSSNSSSEDEEDEEDSGDEFSSSDELDSTRGLDLEDALTLKAVKSKKKYSLFSKSDKTTSWLPSFSSPKQHEVVSTREDEDDIPLAMYQKQKN